ncbi:MAG: ribonuclease E/G [Rubrimonas sp.]
MTDELVLAVETGADGRAMAALVAGGRLEDVMLDPPASDPAPWPETICLGRVDRVAPAMGACFVSLPGGQTGWLRVADARPGQLRIVQVTRWADPGKAVPLTDRVLKGAFTLLTPGAGGVNVSRSVKGHEARERLAAAGEAAMKGAADDLGLVIRTAAADAADDMIAEEVAELREAWASAVARAEGSAPTTLLGAPDALARARRDWPWPDRVIEGEDAFERLGVWDALRDLRRVRVDLPGGAWMTVEATSAVVAVDVNTGDDFGKGAAANANLSACAELPRQLRLRGLGGLIYMDLAPIRKGARQGVDAALKRAFSLDPVETHIAGWTTLGAVEMTRKRERRPLLEMLAGFADV